MSNGTELSLRQYTELLALTIPSGLPTLVVGPPGIGKTDATRQAAEAAGAELIVEYAGLADPTNALGFPWMAPDGKSAEFVPFGQTKKVLEFKPYSTGANGNKRQIKRLVWFWDDLGQGSPAVQASFMPWALAREVNGRKLPPEVTIVAATNRREDRAGVSGILEPVKSRFPVIVHISCAHQHAVEEWCDWAAKQGYHPVFRAFLRYRRELLHKFDPKADIENQPCPRTWAHAAQLYALGVPPALMKAVMTGAIGTGAAAEFVGYLQVWQAIPDLDQLIANPDKAMIPTEPSALWAVVTGLADKTTIKNFDQIARYGDRLLQAEHEEFAVVLARDCQHKEKRIEQTKAWQKLMMTDVGRLIAGEY